MEWSIAGVSRWALSLWIKMIQGVNKTHIEKGERLTFQI